MRYPALLRSALVAPALLVVLAGCAGAATTTGPLQQPVAATEQVAPGDIPDTQAYVSRTAASRAWTIQVPEGWTERATNAGFLLTDKYNVLAAEERTARAALTTRSATDAVVPVLKAAHPRLTVTSVSTVQRPAGLAVLVAYRSDSARDPVTGRVHVQAGEAYVFQESSRRVVIDLAGAVGADDVDPWRHITNSFRWLA